MALREAPGALLRELSVDSADSNRAVTAYDGPPRDQHPGHRCPGQSASPRFLPKTETRIPGKFATRIVVGLAFPAFSRYAVITYLSGICIEGQVFLHNTSDRRGLLSVDFIFGAVLTKEVVRAATHCKTDIPDTPKRRPFFPIAGTKSKEPH